MESKLIVLLVIILGVIAIAQLVRVYELVSKLRDKKEHEITYRDNQLNAKLMLAFMFIQSGGLIYLMLKYGWTGRGIAASVEGIETDWLLNLNFVIVLFIFFITNALLFFFSYKYVKKPGVKAFYYPHNNKLEIIWTVVPAVVLAVIIVLGLNLWGDLTAESPKNARVIELYAKQFDWTARYAGENNKLGKFDYKLTLGTNELGLVTKETIDSALVDMIEGPTGINSIKDRLNNEKLVFNDSVISAMNVTLSRKERLARLLTQMKKHHNAKNDIDVWDDIIQKDTLYLCVDEPLEIKLRSRDIIHSAYFPHFRAQINCVPGIQTRMKFTPNITTKEMRKKMNNNKFNFILMCNKICGGAHYKMKMMVVVLNKKEFSKWWKNKQKDTFKNKYFGSSGA
ncbi:MAG: cytochrome c oxidase subunit II transmembrane domain-containing protein [Crocinitomicaceae bacterium]|nr:cytochrome c oxidase subunit II transmembrane domain-containing protein [Crocinitomicaceae bacterium]